MAAMRRASSGLDFFTLVRSHTTQEHFFELLVTLQAERLEDQRCSPPPPSVEGSPAPKSTKKDAKSPSLLEESTPQHAAEPSSPSTAANKSAGKAKKGAAQAPPKLPPAPPAHIEARPIFLGEASRGEAEEVLAFYPDGTYLVRKSGENYVFCVRWSKSGSPGFVTHVRIEKAKEGGKEVYRMCAIDNFSSVDQVVDFYVERLEIFTSRFWASATLPPPALVPYNPATHAAEIAAERAQKKEALLCACSAVYVHMCM
jgi:hypothetical protein